MPTTAMQVSRSARPASARYGPSASKISVFWVHDVEKVLKSANFIAESDRAHDGASKNTGFVGVWSGLRGVMAWGVAKNPVFFKF